MLYMEYRTESLSSTYYSHECSPQIARIYDKLTAAFGSANPTIDKIDCALEAMERIAPPYENNIAQKSYQLFHAVMQASVSVAYSPEKKWEVSRLTMHGTYKWDRFLLRVEDPQDTPMSLDHHSHFLMLVYVVFIFFCLFLFLLKVFLL